MRRNDEEVASVCEGKHIDTQEKIRKERDRYLKHSAFLEGLIAGVLLKSALGLLKSPTEANDE